MALRTRGNKNKQCAVRIYRTHQGFYRLFFRHKKAFFCLRAEVEVSAVNLSSNMTQAGDLHHRRSVVKDEMFLSAVCVGYCEALQGASERRGRVLLFKRMPLNGHTQEIWFFV